VQQFKSTGIGNDKNFASRKPSFLPRVIFPQGGKEKTPRKANSSTKERSFTELRFASFPHPLWGSSGLSRIEMNALRAPLTALPTPRGRVCLIFT